METLRRARWLSQFELSVSKKHYLILIPLAGIYAFFLRSVMDTYLENQLFFVDFLLVFYLVTSAFSTRPAGVQYQKVHDGLYASPYFVMLYQLPIPRKAILMARFMLMYLSVFIGTSLLFVLTYLVSPLLRETVAVPQFIALVIIWLCISVSIGGLFPASEPGDQIKKYTFFWSYVSIFGFFGAIYLVFNFLLDTGLFMWTIYIANEHTILGVLAFLLFAVLCTWMWARVGLKRIKTLDYLD